MKKTNQKFGLHEQKLEHNEQSNHMKQSTQNLPNPQ